MHQSLLKIRRLGQRRIVCRPARASALALIGIVCFLLFPLTARPAAQALPAPVSRVPADQPPDWVPLGAYLSWERPFHLAKYRGVDHWQDVGDRLDRLVENSVDTLWVTNMAEEHLGGLIQECEKRKLRLLVSLGTIEAKVPERWANPAYYDVVVPRVVKLAGDSKALAGWVLSDEPTKELLPRLEQLRQKFRQYDPRRICLTVTMWPQAPLVPQETKLPVVCVDLYPFFGPNDPNGPHTDDTSQRFFRLNAAAMIQAIGDKPAAGWIMGQSFSEIWGPREFDRRGHLIGLPGAYLHWRSPTPAEMRWQVWETLRSGCKGVFIYTLAPEIPSPETKALPPPEVTWKHVLAKRATDLGPNALTNPDGTATPQLQELGKTYQRVRPHAALIQRWRHLPDFPLTAKPPASAACFLDPQSAARYVVVVNDDLHESATVELCVPADTGNVEDVLSGQQMELTPDFASGPQATRIQLPAGDGTILRLTLKNAAVR